LIAVGNYLDPASAGLSPEKYEAIGENNHEMAFPAPSSAGRRPKISGDLNYTKRLTAFSSPCEAVKRKGERPGESS